jgi:hypothetical protein
LRPGNVVRAARGVASGLFRYTAEGEAKGAARVALDRPVEILNGAVVLTQSQKSAAA